MWQRAGVTDRVELRVAHWDGAAWTDLTLVIPVSPSLRALSADSGHGFERFWSVSPGEAWVWVEVNDAQNNAGQPYATYHLQGGAWDRVPSPLDAMGPSAVPIAAWGSSRNDIWVGGYVTRTVPATGDASAAKTAYDPLLLHFDGAEWTQVSLPIASGNGQRWVSGLWGIRGERRVGRRPHRQLGRHLALRRCAVGPRCPSRASPFSTRFWVLARATSGR